MWGWIDGIFMPLYDYLMKKTIWTYERCPKSPSFLVLSNHLQKVIRFTGYKPCEGDTQSPLCRAGSSIIVGLFKSVIDCFVNILLSNFNFFLQILNFYQIYIQEFDFTQIFLLAWSKFKK